MLLSLAFLPLPVWGHVGVGTLFELGWDAWDVGMAGAGLALASGPGALFTNPAGIAWGNGLEVLCSSSDLFGVASVSSLSASVPGFGIGGIVLDSGPIDEGLRYRAEGAVAALGIPVSENFALGGRVRVLRHVLPQEGIGWAGDLAASLRGPLSIGVVVEGLVARAPVSGESWPPSVSFGLALPLPLGEPLTGALAGAVTRLGEVVAFSLGAELWAQGLGIRVGCSGEKLACAVSVGWEAFRLSLATELHATIPTSFKASLGVMF